MARTGAADILGYVPPELHQGKEWYIDFYARDPLTGEMRRKRIKCNRIKAIAQRKLWARQVMAEITRKLQAGWTPFVAAEPGQAFVTIGDALDQWDRSKVRQLRHSSPYSYTSISSVLREWCREQELLEKYVHAFNGGHASAFMHYLSDVRLIGNRTYNNYLMHCTMLWAYLIERRMAATNPFKGLTKRKQPRKTRTYLSTQERREMVTYTNDHDPHFLLPLLLVYGCLIRPAELKRLRVGHVDIERQVISLPAEITKSGIERWPAIPDWLVPYLRAANLHLLPSKTWLVGNMLEPGSKPVARNTLSNHWVKLRAHLRWDNTKQLYSLRDTGIIQLLRDGVDLLHVMQQAGHTDVDSTNQYLKHAFPHGPAEIKTKATPITAASSIEQ
jgi:integrase